MEYEDKNKKRGFFDRLLYGKDEEEYEEYDELDEEEAEEAAAGKPQDGKLQIVKQSQGVSNICVCRPMSGAERKKIVEQLTLRNPVSLNVEMLSPGMRQRVLDYAQGAVDALQADIKQLSKMVFLLVPKGVSITGDYLDMSDEDRIEQDK